MYFAKRVAISVYRDERVPNKLPDRYILHIISTVHISPSNSLHPTTLFIPNTGLHGPPGHTPNHKKCAQSTLTAHVAAWRWNNNQLTGLKSLWNSFDLQIKPLQIIYHKGPEALAIFDKHYWTCTIVRWNDTVVQITKALYRVCV